MSRSINKVILLGNLTRDPELKYTPAGAAVCTFGLATNRVWTTADGASKEDVQYHRITAWNKLAELCGKFLTKGRKVYLEGRITYNNFTGKDGQQRTLTEIVIDDFVLLDNMRTGEPTKTEGSEASAPQQPSAPDYSQLDEQPTEPEQPAQKNKDMEEEKINPDDIPF